MPKGIMAACLISRNSCPWKDIFKHNNEQKSKKPCEHPCQHFQTPTLSLSL